MNKSILLLTVFIPFLTISGSSQRDWKKGYLCLAATGDTLYGDIFKDWKEFPIHGDDPFLFRSRLSNIEKTYPRTSLSSICVKKEIYQQITIKEDNFPYHVILPESSFNDRIDSLKRLNRLTLGPEKNWHLSQFSMPPTDSTLETKVFAHVLLKTTCFTLFEYNDFKQTFYLQTAIDSTSANRLDVYRLSSATTSTYIFDKFKPELLSQLAVANLPKSKTHRISRMIRSSEYDEKCITTILKRLTKKQGGKVLYSWHRATNKIILRDTEIICLALIFHNLFSVLRDFVLACLPAS